MLLLHILVTTGLEVGASVLLEQKLNRSLLNAACRHHIMELIVTKVFDSLMEASSGTTSKIFQRFSEHWSSIDREDYDPGVCETLIANELNTVKDYLIEFFRGQLSQHQPRDDYKKLIQLALLFLGEAPPVGLKIHALGAFHRARWMTKLIYCLEIYLFCSQFHLTAREQSSLRTHNIIVVPESMVHLCMCYFCTM